MLLRCLRTLIVLDAHYLQLLQSSLADHWLMFRLPHLAPLCLTGFWRLVAWLVSRGRKMSVVVDADTFRIALFTWGSICLAHIRFRAAWKYHGHTVDELPFKAIFGVYGSWVGLTLIVLVLIAQVRR